MEPYEVANVEINCQSVEDAVDKIMAEKESGKAFSVFTLNLDHIAKLRNDERFREAYSRVRFTLPDGFPIALAGRIAGRSVTRACGSDLIDPLCKRAGQAGMSIFLLGSTDRVLQECMDVLVKASPGLMIAGYHAPPQGFDPFGKEAANVIEKIKESNADICFVALGAPKQEFFASRSVDRLDRTAFICIGAGLDFIVGTQQRAPVFYQQYGLEWLWRLASNPSRLTKRYFYSALVLPSVLMSSVLANGRPRH